MVDWSCITTTADSKSCIPEHDKGYGVNVKKLFLVLALVLSLIAPLTARPISNQTDFNAAKAGALRRIAATPSFARVAIPAAEIPSKVLANGLEVIVLEDHSVPVVTIELAVRNGSFTEPPELNGLSHLYEHMFFKSNERSKAEGYHDKAADLGMLSNAQTQYEVVNYYTTTINTGLREAMTFMRDAIRYPLFDKQELDQEIVVVLDELNQHRSNPFFYLFDATDKKLWYK